jgi:beta-lactam-binding protein with PASTA domain
MALKTRVFGVGKLVVLVGALLATYLVFAAGAMRLALRAREVQVPNLSNQTANDAKTMAASVGLAIKVDPVRRLDPKVPAGRVLAQEPTAGSTARQQRTIRVWLSAGSHAVKLPQLVGQTERSAQLTSEQNGIAVDEIAEIRSPDFPADVVIAQTPPADSAAGRVALLVNRGQRGASYVMPDLIGVDGDRAAEILRGEGFRVAVVGSNPYPGVAAGIVIRQNPAAGFRIAPGEPISLEVSR